MMKRSNLTAWLLIFSGVFLLLNYFDLLDLTRGLIAILIGVFLTLVSLNKLISNKEKDGLFGTVFFALTTLLFVAMQYGLMPIDDQLGGGLVLINLSISGLIYFLFTRKKISSLIWSVIFLAIGLPFIIDYYELISLGELSDFYEIYWPVLLIFIGMVVLIDRFFKNRKNTSEEAYHS